MPAEKTKVEELKNLLETHKELKRYCELHPIVGTGTDEDTKREDREKCFKAIFEKIEDKIKEVS